MLAHKFVHPAVQFVASLFLVMGYHISSLRNRRLQVLPVSYSSVVRHPLQGRNTSNF